MQIIHKISALLWRLGAFGTAIVLVIYACMAHECPIGSQPMWMYYVLVSCFAGWMFFGLIALLTPGEI